MELVLTTLNTLRYFGLVAQGLALPPVGHKINLMSREMIKGNILENMIICLLARELDQKTDTMAVHKPEVENSCFYSKRLRCSD